MKRLLLLLTLFAAPALAAYNITVTFDPPATGGVPDGYNLYIDDCASTGPAGSPFGSVTSGQTFTDALPSDGTYRVCVRPFNGTGELQDPGPVATVEVSPQVPGPVENLDITVECKDSTGTVVNCSDAGVNVTVTIS